MRFPAMHKRGCGRLAIRGMIFCSLKCFFAVVKSYLKIIRLIRKQKMTFYGLLVL